MADKRAVCIIPARLASERFPRKVLASDTGWPLIRHVWEAARRARAVERVVIAADAQEIADRCASFGAECVLTSPDHPNGTARLGEAARTLRLAPHDLIVNVQGDEPEIEPEVIDAAVLAHAAQTVIDRAADVTPASGERSQWVGTVATPLRASEDPNDPNLVKVVVGALTEGVGVGPALYFSRSPIPYDRSGLGEPATLRHVGIYAYTVGALEHYLKLEPTPLERAEKLEQLRWLEQGIPIAVAIREAHHVGIDTPEQYAAFVARWRARA